MKKLWTFLLLGAMVISCQKTELETPLDETKAVGGYPIGIGYYGGSSTPGGYATVNGSRTPVVVAPGTTVQVQAYTNMYFLFDCWYQYNQQPPLDKTQPRPSYTVIERGNPTFTYTANAARWFEPVFKVNPNYVQSVTVKINMNADYYSNGGIDYTSPSGVTERLNFGAGSRVIQIRKGSELKCNFTVYYANAYPREYQLEVEYSINSGSLYSAGTGLGDGTQCSRSIYTNDQTETVEFFIKRRKI